ncbi:MAG TPA: DUF6634 family protein [Ancylobacter sp.]
MLTQMFAFLDPAAITPDLAHRLRALATDCERLRQRGSVSPIELQSAPRIDDWVIMQTPLGIQLMGNVTGHPLLGDRAAVTSPLWFADAGGAWIRTLSRFYRLGAPLPPHRIDAFAEAHDLGGDGDDSEGRA